MKLEQLKAVMLGHAVGDALGVPVEFMSRAELAAKPITDMTGFGTYPYPTGAWSDDTSMSLCALESLVKGKYDPDDVMRNFGKWFYKDEFTPTGEMFDIGGTCLSAIEAYSVGEKDVSHCGGTGEQSNGNGSLMRIHPFVMYLADKEMPLANKLSVICSASALTHAHERSKLGCCIYAIVLWSLIKAPLVFNVRLGLAKAAQLLASCNEFEHYKRIFSVGFEKLPSDVIKSSGYVVDTLGAALWCLLTTSSYRECVLKAVNLGSDTDTVAAVAGGLAGALYGLDAIPGEWLDTLIKHDYIEDMCEQAFAAWQAKTNVN